MGLQCPPALHANRQLFSDLADVKDALDEFELADCLAAREEDSDGASTECELSIDFVSENCDESFCDFSDEEGNASPGNAWYSEPFTTTAEDSMSRKDEKALDRETP